MSELLLLLFIGATMIILQVMVALGLWLGLRSQNQEDRIHPAFRKRCDTITKSMKEIENG